MKEYKLVTLNPKLHLNRDTETKEAEETLNQYIKEGWQLQQIVSPNELGGVLIAVLYKEV